MKRISHEECKEWLTGLGVTILPSRDLIFSEAVSRKQRVIFAKFPTDAVALTGFAASLVDWLPEDLTRMLWLKNWLMQPSWHRTFFERARNSFGDEHLIDTPGHIFEAETSKDNFQEDNEEFGEESSIAAGFLFLTMCFDWEAYFLSRDRSDYIYLTDEHVYFRSNDNSQMDRAERICLNFALKVRS